MVEVVKRRRKPPILTPSRIPCLRQFPTINVTEGCALGCTYCYIQGYSHYPGSDRVVLFENTAEVVRAELSRKRRKPRRVYFSPSSDAFQDVPEVQEVTFQTMSVLLAAEVEVAFLTKGFVTERFIRLFAEKPTAVFAQVGITTLDGNLWKAFEPRTAPPQERIETMASLREIGVATTARLDPLVPDLTDTEANLKPLLRFLREAGIGEAAASYLFVRPSFAKKMSLQMGDANPAHPVPATWQYQRFVDGCGGGITLDIDERARRFARMRDLSENTGIAITPCHCKNPELGGRGCEIAGPAVSDRGELASQGLLDFSSHRGDDHLQRAP